MNQEQKDRWVAALRSGDFKQGRGSLAYVAYLGDDYDEMELRNCCLGVGLCVLPEEGAYWVSKSSDLIALWYGDSIFTSMPPDSWQRFAGLNRQIGVEALEYISNHIANPGDLLPTTPWSFILTFLNDQVPATFDQIADIIERFLPVDD